MLTQKMEQPPVPPPATPEEVAPESVKVRFDVGVEDGPALPTPIVSVPNVKPALVKVSAQTLREMEAGRKALASRN